MTTTVQYAKKIGGSIMVRIPKEIAEMEQIIPGEAVEVDIRKAKKDWFGALKGLKSLEKKDKLDVHD